mgnify:CR=1 FL=1
MERVAWSHVERAVELIAGATVDTTGVHFATKAHKLPTLLDRDTAQVVAVPVEAAAPVEVEVEAALTATPVEAAFVVPAATTPNTPRRIEPGPVVQAPAATPTQGYMLLVDIGVVQAPPGWKLQTLEAYLAPIVASFEKAVGGPAFMRDFRAGERTVADMIGKALPADGTMVLVDSACNIWKEASLPLVCGAVGVLRGTR